MRGRYGCASLKSGAVRRSFKQHSAAGIAALSLRPTHARSGMQSLDCATRAITSAKQVLEKHQAELEQAQNKPTDDPAYETTISPCHTPLPNSIIIVDDRWGIYGAG